MEEIILKYWPILTAFAFGLIWFIRLESKVLYLGRDHEKLEKAVAEKDRLLWDKIDCIRNDVTQLLQAIARLEGRLSNRSEKDND